MSLDPSSPGQVAEAIYTRQKRKSTRRGVCTCIVDEAFLRFWQAQFMLVVQTVHGWFYL